MMTKQGVLYAIALLLFTNLQAFAQEEEEKEESGVTEEELMAFAVMEDSVNVVKAQKTEAFNTLLKTHELMDGGRRYMAIKKAYGDEDKLAEAEVTDEELAAFEEIQEKYNAIAGAIKEYKIGYIKETLGVSVYNKVNKAVKKDPALKKQLDAMIVEIKEKREASVADEEEAEKE